MRNIAIGFALATAILSAIGVAYAAIPHSGTGVITACVGYITGDTRIIDAEAGQKCRLWEREVGWNAGGAPGEQGEQGPPGPSWSVYVKPVDPLPFPAPAQSTTQVTLACDSSDEFALSGAYNVEAPNTEIVATQRGATPDTWRFILVNSGTVQEAVSLELICADPTP